MAVNYAMPSWIRGAQPAEKYVQGYGLGLQAAELAARHAMAQQQIQHQYAQMVQEAQLAQMRLNIAQQEQERRRAHDEQYLEVQKEYHKQQADLREAQLEEQKQKVDMAATLMARKFKAQQDIQTDYQRLRQENPEMTPEQAITRATLLHATELQMPMGGIGSLTRAAAAVGKSPFVPGDIKGYNVRDPEGNLIPNMVALPNSSGTGMITRDRTDLQKAVRGRPGEYAKIIENAAAYGLSPEDVEDYKKLMRAEKNERLKAIGETPTGPLPPPPKEQTALQKFLGIGAAQPASPDQVSTPGNEQPYPILSKDTTPVKGELYQTPKGLLYYDGKNFIVPRSKGMQDTTPVAEAEQSAPDAQVAEAESAPEPGETDNEEELQTEEA